MNPLDQITLTGLRANAFHGVFEEERRSGQVFIVDVTVSLDFSKAAASDDLALTIHYGELAEEVVAAVESEPADLIETVAERIATAVLAHPAAQLVTVTLHKPQAPITVPFDDVCVTITRSQSRSAETAGFSVDPGAGS
ncbi:MAG: dihydroneopterin aldolase [Salinibacterium sp.]|nr:dihydroneopterin aldolase [Salinibacterium sp.]